MSIFKTLLAEHHYCLRVVLGACRSGQGSLPRAQLVDVNVQDSACRTALLWASVNGHEDVVKALLTSDKVNVNLQDSAGRTALLFTSGAGRALTGQGFASPQLWWDVNLQVLAGRTALWWGERSTGHVEVAEGVAHQR
ncbi:MAG UNVERIFIED_CONTAM: ankyrin repeat domain-containing protein [Anaerolineae bacterium]